MSHRVVGTLLVREYHKTRQKSPLLGCGSLLVPYICTNVRWKDKSRLLHSNYLALSYGTQIHQRINWCQGSVIFLLSLGCFLPWNLTFDIEWAKTSNSSFSDVPTCSKKTKDRQWLRESQMSWHEIRHFFGFSVQKKI